MPIRVDRHTGKIISKPEITQQQKEEIWKIIVHKWAEKHPNALMKLVPSEAEIED